jgi:hypothetical protein
LKDSVQEELESVFNKFHMNISLGGFSAKVCKGAFSNQQSGINFWTKLVIAVINVVSLKLSQFKLKCSHIGTFVSTLERFQMGKITVELTMF